MNFNTSMPCATALAAVFSLSFSLTALGQSQELIEELQKPGVWASVRDGRVEPSGYWTGQPHQPLWTEWAKQSVEEFDYRLEDPTMGCGQPGMPRLLTVASPMQFDWFGENLLVAKYESFDTARLIYLDRPPQLNLQNSPDGYSNAAWDGDRLVVETTHLDARVQDLEGTPGSDQMTTTEVYYLDVFEDGEVAGQTALNMSITIEDPVAFTEPFTWHFRFVRMEDWYLIPYACEERSFEVAPSTEPPPAAGPTDFTGLDTDGNGHLTLEEFSLYPPANQEGRTPDMPFNILDLDENGLLTMYEFGRQRGPRFVGLDMNSDGFLSIEEIVRLSTNMLGVIALDQLDVDGDLKLDVDEWKESGPRWENFDD